MIFFINSSSKKLLSGKYLFLFLASLPWKSLCMVCLRTPYLCSKMTSWLNALSSMYVKGNFLPSLIQYSRYHGGSWWSQSAPLIWRNLVHRWIFTTRTLFHMQSRHVPGHKGYFTLTVELVVVVCHMAYDGFLWFINIFLCAEFACTPIIQNRFL